MDRKTSQIYFLFALLALTAVLSFFILRPFLFAFVLALVFAVIFQPLQQKILKHTFKHEGLAAFIATLIIVILIFAPLIFLGAQILQELKELYLSLAGGGKDNILNALDKLAVISHRYFPSAQDLSISIDQYLKQGLSWLLSNLGAVFSNFAKIIVTAFLFIFSLYYLLKDGRRLRQKIINLSPLNDADDEIIIKKLELAISSVIRGNFAIAFIQGALTTLGFSIFAVPNAILWGAAATIASLIPSLGTSLIFIPAIILMFVSGQILSAGGLLLWGVLAVGLVDNFLGPKLIGRGMKLHPLLVLLSVLGGIGFFGVIGFILGPIILSLLFTLFDIYPYVNSNQRVK